jgi:hypothetical protein
MLNVWTKLSGSSLGFLREQITINISLPVTNDSGVVYRVISGALPSGLYISGNHIIGSPYIVANKTDYEFCIRASLGTEISDRTFRITIDGNNPPIFVTPAGLLPVGPNKQLYTTDQTYLEYQIQVSDLNVVVGKSLNFYIASGDGSLPPGLSLSSSGLISGYIQPAPKITLTDGSGRYDDIRYDSNVFDFGLVSNNGFDSYQYDDVQFDYYEPTAISQTLSLNYQFKVTVTDSINYAQRVFKIFVAGTDEFRADSTTYDGLADGFSADSTYVRRPQWLSSSNLGVFRSNNYMTVPVALYDNRNVVFRLDQVNHDCYAVAYQISMTDNILGSASVTVDNVSVAPTVGQYFTLDFYVDGATDQLYQILQVSLLSKKRYRLLLSSKLAITIPNNTAFYTGSLCSLPPGVNFDGETGDLYGIVPYQPSVSEKYTFTITATRPGDTNEELVSSSKTFYLIVLGNVHSVITWVTPENLGVIPADYISTLSVVATTSVANAVVTYEVVDGNLPPGITLTTDGELTGIPNQFNNSLAGVAGLISFDSSTTTFDLEKTTFDRVYTFSVQAADQYGYSAITRNFSVTISSPNSLLYNNITARPYLIPNQRTLFSNFINNSNIFTPESIYRPNDNNFGIQADLTMLVYAGIQSKEAAAYISAMGLNMKRKRFQFGSLKKAVAIDPASNTAVYEVVYVQMIDPLEPNGKHLPLSIKTNANASEKITVDLSNSIWSNKISDFNSQYPELTRPDYTITADSTGYEINTSKPDTFFPNSITNWQTRFSQIGLSERNYLPLWMRSIQLGQKQQLGYVLAIPLCFCKVGTADTILLNIKHSPFDFTQLDYTIDRYTITSAAGYASDKYLIFKNNRITV